MRIRFRPVTPRPLPSAVALVTLLALQTGALPAKEVPLMEVTVAAAFDGPQHAVSADLDDDGDLDVIGVANFGDEVVWWENLLGDATGWSEHLVTSTLDSPRAVAAADLDADGDLDLVSGSWSGGSVLVLLNAGDASSWVEVTAATGLGGVRGLSVRDIDRDGDADVVVAAETADTVVWLQNGGDANSWTERTVSASFDGAHAVTTFDLDRDGDFDVVGAAVNGDRITWWENLDTVGLAWLAHDVDATFDGARGVTVSDVDGDGDPDLVGAARDDDAVTWWENLDGLALNWSEHVVSSTFDGAVSVDTRDLDRDGDQDVVAAAVLDDQVTWWENLDGAGTSWLERPLATALDGPFSVAIADLDSDGDPDLLAPGFNDDRIAWWRNDSLHRRPHYENALVVVDSIGANSPAKVIIADIDSDGDGDLVQASYYAGGLCDEFLQGDPPESLGLQNWYENTAGDGSVWTPRYMPTGGEDVIASDLDFDGDLDIVRASFSGGYYWGENLGALDDWDLHAIDAYYDECSTHVAVADFDLDGDLDVVGGSNGHDLNDQRVNWIENVVGDATTWTVHNLYMGTWTPSVSTVAAGDLDGDGDPDIAAGGSINSWWENRLPEGIDTWVQHSTSPCNSGDLEIVDVDGDGHLDILNGAEWCENVDGTGLVWATHSIGTGSSKRMTFADLDEDGDLDSIDNGGYWDTSGPQFHWNENVDGAGLVWVQNEYGALVDVYPGGVAVGDIDGDGDLDIATAEYDYDIEAGRVDWWPNEPSHYRLGPTLSVAPEILFDSELEDLLSIEVAHLGKPGDGALRITSMSFRFERAAFDPLTAEEASSLFTSFALYLDDGDLPNVFEPTSDTLVLIDHALALNDGWLPLDLPASPVVEVSPDEPAKLFAVVQMRPDAFDAGIAAFRLVHNPNSSDALDIFDIALDGEPGPFTATALIDLAGSAVELTATGTCPGPVTLAVTDATPNSSVVLAWSTSTGETLLSMGGCAGVTLGLQGPQILTTVVTDGSGTAEFGGNAPAGACGAFLQGVDLATCRPTTVTQVP